MPSVKLRPMVTKIVAIILLSASLFGGPAVQRPAILGVAHMAIYVKDLARARHFYEDFLGFGEPFTLPAKGGGVRIAFVKINDRQYLELFNEKDRGEGQLNHISFYTSNAGQMRDYLASRGVEVPAKITKGQTGNWNFNVKDPDGHIVEFVEYLSDSWTAREAGKFMPSTRLADRIMHVGVLVGDLDKSTKFYGDVLGFKEFWRGSSSPRMLSWVNLKVPDGDDYLEFMLYDRTPEPEARGTKNHLCLMVPDADKTLAQLKERAARGLYTPVDGKEMKIQIGVNRKRQINLYDPDGTRIEVMEPFTVDGKSSPNSTAPPPRPARN